MTIRADSTADRSSRVRTVRRARRGADRRQAADQDRSAGGSIRRDRAVHPAQGARHATRGRGDQQGRRDHGAAARADRLRSAVRQLEVPGVHPPAARARQGRRAVRRRHQRLARGRAPHRRQHRRALLLHQPVRRRRLRRQHDRDRRAARAAVLDADPVDDGEVRQEGLHHRRRLQFRPDLGRVDAQAGHRQRRPDRRPGAHSARRLAVRPDHPEHPEGQARLADEPDRRQLADRRSTSRRPPPGSRSPWAARSPSVSASSTSASSRRRWRTCTWR